MCCLILLCLFLTFCVRSVCAFMHVCLGTHMSQGGITFMLVIRHFFEGIMLVENEPPCGESWLRA